MTTNLPTLTGSEKQIAWAEDIRKEMLNEKRGGQLFSEMVAKFYAFTEEQQQQVAEYAKADPLSTIGLAYYIATEESAAWFIEHRPHGCIKYGNKTIMRW